MHDFVCLDFIINLEGEEISGSSELELCDAVFLVLLYSNLLGTWKVLLFSSDDLDEFLKILDFLWLYRNVS